MLHGSRGRQFVSKANGRAGGRTDRTCGVWVEGLETCGHAAPIARIVIGVPRANGLGYAGANALVPAVWVAPEVPALTRIAP